MIHDPKLLQRLGPLSRTVEAVLPEADLAKKLARGKPLRAKLGIDATSASIHVGNGIPLWNLRALQDLGHTAVLIIGDSTALVGDPSGKDKTRPMLSPAEVAANVATWLEQIGKILDLSRAEVRRNSEWFAKMPFLEVLALADRMTVQQMLERDSFEKRFAAGSPISIREFLYCLMQGWDSVMVRADVELGGTDQTFNLGVGRRLMEQQGMEPQVSLISPLIEGTDGQAKMSKSLGNSIGLSDPPQEMFGKAMRISDALLSKFLRLLTDLSEERISALLAPGLNPRDAKLALGEALVSRYHGAKAASAARAEFVHVISERQPPAEMPEVSVPAGRPLVWELVKACGFAKTNSEARRLIEQGGVAVLRGTAVAWEARDATATFEARDGDVVKVGTRRYARLRVSSG